MTKKDTEQLAPFPPPGYINPNILQAAIDRWGRTQQTNMIIEECLELAYILHKIRRMDEVELTAQYVNICDEIADVKIMITQAERIFDKATIDERVEYKMKRLAAKLDDEVGVEIKENMEDLGLYPEHKNCVRGENSKWICFADIEGELTAKEMNERCPYNPENIHSKCEDTPLGWYCAAPNKSGNSTLTHNLSCPVKPKHIDSTEKKSKEDKG